MDHVHVNSSQWVVSDDDIAAIVDAYGLTLCRPGAVPLGGAVNGVARIGTDAGEVVLRVHRPWTTAARLEGVHRVQAHVRAAGLPVPAVLVTRDGRSWMWRYDRLVEASTYVGEGDEADSWTQFAVSIPLLGDLHTALASFPPAMVPPPAYSSFADPETALAMLAETDADFRSCADLEGYAAAHAIREETRDLWGWLHRERLHYADGLPRSLIHGDFLGKNVLFAGECVIAVLDFDRLAWRERIHDLAVTLYCVLGRLHRALPADHPPSAADLMRLAGLVTAYEATAPLPLTAAEVVALPFEMARVPLYPVASAGYLAAAGDMQGAIADTRSVEHQLPRARWLTANADRLHAALTQGPRSSS